MKITKYILSFAAAAGLLAACQTPEIVQIASPEDIVPAALHELEVDEIVITADNQKETISFTWEKADYGASTQIRYSLEAALDEQSSKVTILSGLSATSAVITFEELNRILFNDLKIPAGQATPLKIYVGSVLYAGSSISSYPKVYSQPVTLTATVTAAEKIYPMIYMPGSYQSWSPANAPANFQVLYDFEGNGIFEGIADFCQSNDAERAWKFTPEPDWDFDWGVPKDAKVEPEAAEITLINNDGGDRSDIKAYTLKRFYHFSMDTNTGLLKHNYSFDQVGLVGTITGWADGQDKVMEFNASKRRFYVDVEGLSGEFKFRLDGAWTKNWGAGDFGVTVSNADGNLEAAEGNYRVYLYLSNPKELKYELNKSMYGQEEPTAGTTTPDTPEPEPTPVVGWGLVGEYNGWGAEPDVMLASDGTYLAAKGVALSGQVKFRKDGDWAVNFGAPGEVEPVEVAVNTELEVVANGKNFTIAEGTYDVYLDETNAKAWFITDGSYPGGAEAPVAAEWGLIGSLAACNNWSNNVVLYVSGDYSVAKGVQFAAGDQFKFRKGEAWGVELTYEGQITIDAKLDLIDGTGGKQNSSIAEGGSFDVYLANDLSAFYVMTPGKTPADAGAAQKVYTDPSAESFVVGFSGSAIGWDDPSFDTNDRAAFVSKNVTDATTYAGTYEFQLENFAVAAGDEFKVRINGQWIGVGGATVEGLKVSGSDNFVADEAGTYTATITFAWDGSNHSDVKVVFASEASALTIDGKQWAFDWEMMGAPVRLDLGVSIPGYCMIGFDLGLWYPDDPEAAGMWMAYIEGYYEIEVLSETTGKIWLMSADPVTGDLVPGMSIDYSGLTDTEVTLDCESFGILGARALYCPDTVNMMSQGIAM